MTLHDWIDELCDALDIETEVDEGIVLDLTRDVSQTVERAAAPISAYLLGYAAGQREADPDEVERLTAAATALAEKWGGEDDEADEDVAEIEELDEELVDAE